MLTMREELNEKNVELVTANKSCNLIKSKDVQEFIINPYIETELVRLVKLKAMTKNKEDLDYIDRQIDSIGMFRRYLAEIEDKPSKIEKDIQSIKQELG